MAKLAASGTGAGLRITTYGYDSSIWPALRRNFSCIDDFSQELLARVKIAANELTGEVPFSTVRTAIPRILFMLTDLSLDYNRSLPSWLPIH